MIEVIYHREHNRVTIKGHAESGEIGHDLVCASASILAYTLAASVNDAHEAGIVRDPVIHLNEGDTEISCQTVRKWKAVIKVIFSTVLKGFAILSQKYPENISYHVMG